MNEIQTYDAKISSKVVRINNMRYEMQITT